jgi:hypothetical protein
MQSEEQRLIEGLFQRLQKAEQETGARDSEADRQIQAFIRQQPSAPYYMAQSILIQEAALKRLHQQVQQLESEVAELKNAAPAQSGGFLSNLFGGGASRASRPQQPSAAPWGNGGQQTPPPGYGQTPPPGYNGYAQTPPPGYNGYAAQQPPMAPSGGGFMAGALQTAAGVAGGVVLGNMLTSMFHHSQPQEIVNIIDQPMNPGVDSFANQDFNSGNLDTFNDVSDSHFLDQNNNYLADDSKDNDFSNNDFSNNDFGNDDDFGGSDGFNDDDDNFI